MKQCKHCQLYFDVTDKAPTWFAGHVNWCTSNPKRELRLKKLADARKETYKSVDKMKESLKRAHEEGKYKGAQEKLKGKGKKHTEETKEKLRQLALKSTHRRLLKSTSQYEKLDGQTVLLDSSWEVALAERLDFLKIEWERPKDPIIWIDQQGRNRNYFADFFLPKFNLFLDPKNPCAVLNQKEKVEWLKNNRNDVNFLYSLKECKEFML